MNLLHDPSDIAFACFILSFLSTLSIYYCFYHCLSIIVFSAAQHVISLIVTASSLLSSPLYTLIYTGQNKHDLRATLNRIAHGCTQMQGQAKVILASSILRLYNHCILLDSISSRFRRRKWMTKQTHRCKGSHRLLGMERLRPPSQSPTDCPRIAIRMFWGVVRDREGTLLPVTSWQERLSATLAPSPRSFSFLLDAFPFNLYLIALSKFVRLLA